MRRFIAALVLVSSVAVCAASDLDSAKKAYAAREWGRAARLLQPPADAGNAEAAYLLGRVYWLGSPEVKTDEAKALRYFRLAAAAGSADAAEDLGLAYFKELLGLPFDPELSNYWHCVAAKGGNEAAVVNLELDGIDAKTGCNAILKNMADRAKSPGFRERKDRILADGSKIPEHECWIIRARDVREGVTDGYLYVRGIAHWGGATADGDFSITARGGPEVRLFGGSVVRPGTGVGAIEATVRPFAECNAR